MAIKKTKYLYKIPVIPARNFGIMLPMPNRTKWLWEVYLPFFVILALGRAVSFLAPQTPEHLYFKILYSFNSVFYISYSLSLAQVVLTLIHILPLALYTFRAPFLSPRLWQYLFILRAIFDLTGHPYEMNTIVSMYHTSPQICALTVLLAVLPYLPSYWAGYAYAFRQDILFVRGKKQEAKN